MAFDPNKIYTDDDVREHFKTYRAQFAETITVDDVIKFAHDRPSLYTALIHVLKGRHG